MLKSLPVALLIAAITVPPAVAQDTTAPTTAKPVKEKRTCRRIVPTGSIMPKSFCLTAADWKEFNAKNQHHADMLINGNRVMALNLNQPQ